MQGAQSLHANVYASQVRLFLMKLTSVIESFIAGGQICNSGSEELDVARPDQRQRPSLLRSVSRVLLIKKSRLRTVLQNRTKHRPGDIKIAHNGCERRR